jgi:hypothetical protein
MLVLRISHKMEINTWHSPIGFSLPILSSHPPKNIYIQTKNTKSNYHPKRKRTVSKGHLFEKGGMLFVNELRGKSWDHHT